MRSLILLLWALVAFSALIYLLSERNSRAYIFAENSEGSNHLHAARSTAGSIESATRPKTFAYAYVTALKDDSELYQRLTRSLVKQLKQVFPTSHDVVVYSCGYYGIPLRYSPDIFESENVVETTKYIKSLGAATMMFKDCHIQTKKNDSKGYRDWEALNQCAFCMLSHLAKYKAIIALDNDVLLTDNFDHLFPVLQPGILAAVRNEHTRANGGFFGFGLTETLGEDLQSSFLATSTYTCHGGANNSDWNTPVSKRACHKEWNNIQSFFAVYFETRHRLLSLDRRYNYILHPKYQSSVVYDHALPLQDVQMFHFIGCKKGMRRGGLYERVWYMNSDKVASFCGQLKASAARRTKDCSDICEIVLCQIRLYEGLTETGSSERGLFSRTRKNPSWAVPNAQVINPKTQGSCSQPR